MQAVRAMIRDEDWDAQYEGTDPALKAVELARVAYLLDPPDLANLRSAISCFGEAGEFDFNSGRIVPDDNISIQNFAGSITEDDDGFIYIADVGNRRIQKFAP